MTVKIARKTVYNYFKKIKGAFFGFLGKVLVGTCLGFPLWVLSRTLPNGFHLEPFGVLPPGQRIEPLKVLDRTFLAKRVKGQFEGQEKVGPSQ